MGTRSDIIIKRPGKEEYASIHCHWDGYPSHNGKILLQNYTTHDEVVDLIQQGDLSQLKEDSQSSVSYHRWRGEEKNIKCSNHLGDLIQEDYSYLFKDGEWWFTGYGADGQWKKLTADICTID